MRGKIDPEKRGPHPIATFSHSLSSAKLQPPTFFVITIIIRNYPEESNNPEHDAHEDLDDKLGLESVKTTLCV